MTLHSKYFYGNEVSSYGLENGYLDYGTLAAAFPHILNNSIMQTTENIGYWECVSGNDYDEEADEYAEVYQTYIVDDEGARILQEAGEIVYRNDELDMNVWGVTHWGTGWSHVLTSVKIEL